MKRNRSPPCPFGVVSLFPLGMELARTGTNPGKQKKQQFLAPGDVDFFSFFVLSVELFSDLTLHTP